MELYSYGALSKLVSRESRKMCTTPVPFSLDDLCDVIRRGEDVPHLNYRNVDLKIEVVEHPPDNDGNGAQSVLLYTNKHTEHLTKTKMKGDGTFGPRPLLQGCAQLLTLTAQSHFNENDVRQ